MVFKDTIKSYGTTTAAVQEQPALLTAYRYLKETLEGGAAKCPFYDYEDVCHVERDYACSALPWARGDIGNEERCELGLIGELLSIENAEFSRA